MSRSWYRRTGTIADAAVVDLASETRNQVSTDDSTEMLGVDIKHLPASLVEAEGYVVGQSRDSDWSVIE